MKKKGVEFCWECDASAGCEKWKMLGGFNDQRSKSCYCIAATVMEPGELKKALTRAEKESAELDIKGKAKTLRKILDDIAAQKGYLLKLRK